MFINSNFRSLRKLFLSFSLYYIFFSFRFLIFLNSDFLQFIETSSFYFFRNFLKRRLLLPKHLSHFFIALEKFSIFSSSSIVLYINDIFHLKKFFELNNQLFSFLIAASFDFYFVNVLHFKQILSYVFFSTYTYCLVLKWLFRYLFFFNMYFVLFSSIFFF